MSNDDRSFATSRPRFTRFGLASLLVLLAAIAVAIAMGIELSKTEVTAYIQVHRSTAPGSWPPEWFPRPDDAEFDTFRATQIEILRSKSLLTRAVRDPSVAQVTFLARKHDPVDWLQKHLKIDYPNDAELLRVRLFTSEPEEGVKIVNAVINTYFREVVEKEITERARTETKLRDVLQQLGDLLVRDKKDVQRLTEALGAEGAAASVELELKQKHIKQIEQQWDDLGRQVERLQITKHVPPRVQLLDEANFVK
jgi:uncharacterized protein involved in exopolysaccharide biosynthesis